MTLKIFTMVLVVLPEELNDVIKTPFKVFLKIFSDELVDTITTQSTLHEKCPYSEFFWSVISRIWNEYGEILRISP